MDLAIGSLLGVRMLGRYVPTVERATRSWSVAGQTMVQDACTTVTPELHASAVRTLRDRYCRVVDTATAVREVHRRG